VIVVDSSSDGTDKIASKYGVKIVRTPPTGLNVARNHGIHASSGDIICFTDGDCKVSHDWITKIVSEFEKDPQIGCVGGPVIVDSRTFWGRYTNETLVSIFPRYTKTTIISSNQLSNQPFNVRYPVGCNMAFRREVLEQLGGFKNEWKSAWDEFELMHRLIENGYSIAINPEIVVYHQSRTTLLEMLRQVYRYGAGAGKYGKIFRIPVLKNRIKFAVTGLFLTWSHSMKVYKKSRRRSSLLYPFADIVIGGSYYFGFIRGYVKKSKEKIF
jgi:cellulose synthase/poly-beta-1,6-N-acetylglucosamine synthase-like glycosyltransferase